MSEAEASPRKKKRLGFRRACIPCRQKKNRCDGRKPRCLGCASRGLRCEYGPSESTQNDFIIPDVTTTSPQRDHARGLHLSRPEESNGLGQTSLSPHQPAFRYPGDPTQRSPDEERERRPSSSIWSGTGAGTSGGNIPSPVSQTLSQPDGYFGDSSSFRFVSKIRPGPHTERSEPTPTIETVLTQDAFESPNSLVQVGPRQRDGFPPQDVADRLVDAHFERVHVFYPFMHEGTFRARYEGLWAENPKDQAEPAVWLAVVNLVFAFGYEFVAEQQDNFATLAAPFVNRAKDIIVSHMLTSTNLHLVQALLLLCHYLQGTLQLNECWNLVGLMIRSAVSIGLHLNPTKDGSFSMVAKEERKRAWWGCVVLDRTLSMKFGRPPSIIFDDARDVDLPLDVDDQYITEASIAPRQPWGLPPRLSFFIHTIKLSEIIASVLSRMYGTRRNPQVETNRNLRWSLCPEDSAKLGNAVLLDGHLQAWWDAMPLHLKAEPDLLDGRDFQRQRLVIRMRYLQLRLLLQRPSFVLFCKNEIKDEFLKNVALSSSQVCISTARETILLIHRHYDKQLLNSLSYILHCKFEPSISSSAAWLLRRIPAELP
ncbi:hypothetical protein NW767_010798 [Fusarium falciforme]|nr:hypothetical protein NW767_010798 [Fusarium falciforme]